MLSPHPVRFLSRPLALLGALALSAVAATAQAQPPAVDPALPEQLKELKSMVSDPKMVADFQAIQFIQQKLMPGLDQRNPKDKERLAKALGEVFRTGKLRPADKDLLYRETADALAKFGADGGKELQKAATDKRFDDLRALQAHLILALGRTQDEKQVEWLLETTIRSPHDELKAAAGEALGNYTSLDIKQRREIVKGVVREWGSLHSRATQADSTDPNAPIDPAPQNARRTLQVVEGRWNASLQKLTGASNAKFEEWQRWLNKNPNWTPGGGR